MPKPSAERLKKLDLFLSRTEHGDVVRLGARADKPGRRDNGLDAALDACAPEPIADSLEVRHAARRALHAPLATDPTPPEGHPSQRPAPLRIEQEVRDAPPPLTHAPAGARLAATGRPTRSRRGEGPAAIACVHVARAEAGA
jgi:hypothetical protein